MNWSRTKSIFIVAFLILNSFLGYQLWEKQTKKIELAQIYESSLDELLLLKHIKLETELSAEQPEMSQLNAQFMEYTLEDLSQMEGQSLSFDQYQLISTLNTPFSLASPWKPEEFYQQFVKERVIKGERYALDQHTETEIVYLQQVQSYPIFVGQLIFQKNKTEEVTGYQQTFYYVINQGTEQPVISSFTSIRTLLDNQIIPTYTVIKEVDLGYYGQIYETESQVLTPVWRIMIEHQGNPMTIYVNAITGAIESAPIY
jgi:regulatory protein YycI of two-component signal transduction system YycFG